ncbi:MAG: MBL fold metallo-hydrolase [Bacteroidota bacterium]
MKKWFKRMLWSFLVLVALLVVGYLAFVSFYPSFGGDVSKDRKEAYVSSSQFEEGAFRNTVDNIPPDIGFSEGIQLGYKFFTTKVPRKRPKKQLPVQTLNAESVAEYAGATRLVWYGHSSFLLQSEGKNILLDPMFSDVAAPHPLLGEKRFTDSLPLAISELPQIDAVIISHDHYDHLDYESIRGLKDKVKHFFTPLGVGVHLEAWGVNPNQITEMDWWESTTYEGMNFTATPAQHFSGRKFSNRQETLWSSWVIELASKERIYFSGDSGYSDHFKEIGEKHGPFDLALMECGQYNESWSTIHMMPEETAQAGADLRAKQIMPIHWAGFRLALHSWTDPIERVRVAAENLQVPLIAPKIGEPFQVQDSTRSLDAWWEEIE